MKSSRRYTPNVNAGSMADIAFLLLIFFLVTTTISADKGILRKLPKLCPPGQICDEIINERNIFRIWINHKQEIKVEDDLITIDELKDATKLFLDNNGEKSCGYCSGASNAELSDHPTSAVISLKIDPLVKYELYIAVQDQLTKAFYELRESYAKTKFNKSVNDLTPSELDMVRDAYPFKLSEADIIRE